jgi:hypothetical protein
MLALGEQPLIKRVTLIQSCNKKEHDSALSSRTPLGIGAGIGIAQVIPETTEILCS